MHRLGILVRILHDTILVAFAYNSLLALSTRHLDGILNSVTFGFACVTPKLCYFSDCFSAWHKRFEVVGQSSLTRSVRSVLKKWVQ